MDVSCRAILLISALCLACVLGGAPAQAQTISGTPGIALKSGESFELGDAYWISSTCNSMLVGTPEVEILDGPPGVTVTVKDHASILELREAGEGRQGDRRRERHRPPQLHDVHNSL